MQSPSAGYIDPTTSPPIGSASSTTAPSIAPTTNSAYPDYLIMNTTSNHGFSPYPNVGPGPGFYSFPGDDQIHSFASAGTTTTTSGALPTASPTIDTTTANQNNSDIPSLGVSLFGGSQTMQPSYSSTTAYYALSGQQNPTASPTTDHADHLTTSLHHSLSSSSASTTTPASPTTNSSELTKNSLDPASTSASTTITTTANPASTKPTPQSANDNTTNSTDQPPNSPQFHLPFMAHPSFSPFPPAPHGHYSQYPPLPTPYPVHPHHHSDDGYNQYPYHPAQYPSSPPTQPSASPTPATATGGTNASTDNTSTLYPAPMHSSTSSYSQGPQPSSISSATTSSTQPPSSQQPPSPSTQPNSSQSTHQQSSSQQQQQQQQQSHLNDQTPLSQYQPYPLYPAQPPFLPTGLPLPLSSIPHPHPGIQPLPPRKRPPRLNQDYDPHNADLVILASQSSYMVVIYPKRNLPSSSLAAQAPNTSQYNQDFSDDEHDDDDDDGGGGGDNDNNNNNAAAIVSLSKISKKQTQGQNDLPQDSESPLSHHTHRPANRSNNTHDNDNKLDVPTPISRRGDRYPPLVKVADFSHIPSLVVNRMICDFWLRFSLGMTQSNCQKGHRCKYFHPTMISPSCNPAQEICRNYLITQHCAMGPNCTKLHPIGRVSFDLAVQIGMLPPDAIQKPYAKRHGARAQQNVEREQQNAITGANFDPIDNGDPQDDDIPPPHSARNNLYNDHDVSLLPKPPKEPNHHYPHQQYHTQTHLAYPHHQPPPRHGHNNNPDAKYAWFHPPLAQYDPHHHQFYPPMSRHGDFNDGVNNNNRYPTRRTHQYPPHSYSSHLSGLIPTSEHDNEEESIQQSTPTLLPSPSHQHNQNGPNRRQNTNGNPNPHNRHSHQGPRNGPNGPNGQNGQNGQNGANGPNSNGNYSSYHIPNLPHNGPPSQQQAIPTQYYPIYPPNMHHMIIPNEQYYQFPPFQHQHQHHQRRSNKNMDPGMSHYPHHHVNPQLRPFGSNTAGGTQNKPRSGPNNPNTNNYRFNNTTPPATSNAAKSSTQQPQYYPPQSSSGSQSSTQTSSAQHAQGTSGDPVSPHFLYQPMQLGTVPDASDTPYSPQPQYQPGLE